MNKIKTRNEKFYVNIKTAFLRRGKKHASTSVHRSGATTDRTTNPKQGKLKILLLHRGLIKHISLVLEVNKYVNICCLIFNRIIWLFGTCRSPNIIWLNIHNIWKRTFLKYLAHEIRGQWPRFRYQQYELILKMSTGYQNKSANYICHNYKNCGTTLIISHYQRIR